MDYTQFPNKLFMFLVTILAVASAQASTNRTTGEIFISQLGHSVGYEKDQKTKEFTIEYRDLVDVKLEAIGQQFDTKKCGYWRKAAKVSGGILQDATPFEGTPIYFRLTIFKLDPSSIQYLFGPDWTYVGQLQTSQLSLSYRWKDTSDIMLAGPAIGNTVQQEIAKSLDNPTNRGTLNAKGYVEFSSKYPIFACDMMNGDVAVTLNFNGVEFGNFHIVSDLRPSLVSNLSQSIVNHFQRLSGYQSQFLPNETQQIARAAGLLGYEMAKYGMDQNNMLNGDFYSLYLSIFKNGTDQPQTLSMSQSQELVQSMTRVEYQPKDLQVVQSLNLSGE